MGYKLLLVDDSSVVRKVFLRTLGMTDIKAETVLEANHGQEALDILRREPVDMVFLDINMPVMNGIQFMEALRGDEALKNTPVIVVSTEGSQERRQHMAKLGVLAYLRKPTTPEALATVVNHILGGTTNGN